ncbi:MAG: hypothetical protein ACKN9G_00205, partial [Candidatus Limnocylindrus sp.]
LARFIVGVATVEWEYPWQDQEETRVLKVMADLAHEGRTMIVVTHEMDFAHEAADRVYYMDQGEFAEVGPPEQVIDAPHDPRTKEFLSRFRTLGAKK